MSPSSLRQAAEAVLMGTRLEDKLSFPDRFVDDAPGAPLRSPEAPGRPAELRFGDAAPFPTSDLEDPAQRGRALHFFANHELLALETMALVLLRFPDAPPALRRGVAHTLREEQEHLRKYLARMEALGVELGATPVNDFFWRIFRSVPTIEAYLAGMSLTFEQANLDHSAWFAERFGSVGDEASAQVMYEVLEDEIRHVGFGRTWLGRLRPQQDLWNAYIDSLPAPLTPRRARGRRLLRAPRQRAGLPARFVDQVSLAADSRGRTPVLWVFDPTGPADLSRAARRVRTDLAPLLALLAPPDDAVFTPVRPSERARMSWVEAGLEPRRFVVEGERFTALRTEVFGPSGCAPTGISAEEGETAPSCTFGKDFSLRVERRLLARHRSPEISRTPGWWCTRLGEVRRRSVGPAAHRWKARFGTAGRGQRVVLQLCPQDLAWAARQIARDGGIRVEPELDVVMELGVLLERGASATALAAWTDPRGRYIGHDLGDPFRQLGRLAGPRTAGIRAALADAASHVRAELCAVGYRGPAGIDAVIHRDPRGNLRVRPIMEVNPRRTMGHIARALSRRVAPGAPAAHVLLTLGDARRAGFPSLQALAAGLPSNLTPGARGWTDGHLWTTDPGAEAAHAGLLGVGAEAFALIRRLARA